MIDQDTKLHAVAVSSCEERLGRMKRFNIGVSASYSLSVAEIWPDGDAPEKPTVQHVIEKLKSECGNVTELIRDWNLDDGLCVDVNGVPVNL